MNEHTTARPFAASFVIIRKNGRVAFLLRQNTKWMNGYWGLPSGKVEANETFKEAAIHEAEEEVGIVIKEADLKHLLTVYRKADDKTDCWVDIYFEAGEWSGEVVNAEPHMHAELAWLELSSLPENIVPSVKFALKEIEAGKNYTEYNWK